MAVFRRKRRVKRADGRTVVKQSSKWYVKYRDGDGIVRCVPGYTDREATKQLEARLVKEAALAKEGVVDRYKEHRVRPLREHLEDFHASLLAKGNTAKHAKLTFSRAAAVINGCQFGRWGDISASRVERFLAGLRNDGEGISAQTFNFYLQAVKQFCRWMVQDRRASESPVAHLKGLNVRTDRRHDRRALEVEEVRQLLEVTKGARRRYCMTGPERAMLYRLAVETGLRAGELRSLTVGSFDLDSCLVEVAAGYSKRRRLDRLPLRRETAAELRAFFAGKLPNAKAFRMPSKSRVANMIKADLRDTGIPYVDEAGRYADFHGLRHTTGSFLAAAGVHPKVAQAILRHSKMDLTMSVYTHTLRGQESEAVGKLPDLSVPSKHAAEATGTDGREASTSKHTNDSLTPQWTPAACSGRQALSACGSGPSINEEVTPSGKPASKGSLGTKNPELAAGDNGKRKRRRSDSNRRITVLQTVALGLLATPPSIAR